jgi:hypothetical protein
MTHAFRYSLRSDWLKTRLPCPQCLPDSSKRILLGSLFQLVRFHNQFYIELFEESSKDPSRIGALCERYADSFRSFYTKVGSANWTDSDRMSSTIHGRKSKVSLNNVCRILNYSLSRYFF